MKPLLTKQQIQNNITFCHNDLNPMNIIFKHQKVQAIIDWDGIGLGRVTDDILYILWTCANIGDIKRKIESILKKIRIVINVYGNEDNIFNNLSNLFIDLMDRRLSLAKEKNMQILKKLLIELIDLKNSFWKILMKLIIF